MQVVLAISSSDPRTLQRQLFEQIRRLILDNKLRSGDPVPASRALSEQLGVSRNTVVLAYEQLRSEGYIESRPNVGTFVSATLPETAMAIATAAADDGDALANDNNDGLHPVTGGIRAQTVISPNRGRLEHDFWIGRVDAATFPANEWRRILDAKVRYGGARLAEYQDPQGLRELRQGIAEHIGPARGVSARADDIVIVNGSQDGLDLVARALAGFSRTFVHEDPCYQGSRFLFESCGFTPHPVPVDHDGIDVSRLPAGRRNILYVTPSHQYPLGVTLSPERRLNLLDWAERTDSYVIEDDYDGDFRYEGAPLTALRGLDGRGRVLYLGTFSKSLAAGLRLGFIVAPPTLSGALREWKSLTSNGNAWLEQAAMAEFMTSGGFLRHLRRIRAIYKRRRDLLVEALTGIFPGAEIRGMRGGMHLSLRLPAGFGDAREIERRSAARGVGIYVPGSGGAFITADNPRVRDTLLFGYAALSEKSIASAMRRLADAVAECDRNRAFG
ncbi:MocR-like pyridoxine biosynthesis transcription factor PdxR [Oceanibacterium hippocampi]|uniref:HTH-type transcriptional regulatory protein GabR n=1 Tax=Oceanibacterium hippocampi TaxID=745714 RepID=A0A1Y5U1B1_9PROT|nr:PLP-dependent aminotransferase family protein [Oceanibacterium hippocampi]SLN76618.1 HTH-type transcriptional regulatory protein GabR [Oceanibacterium hippocampi]